MATRDAFVRQWLKRKENWGKAAPMVHPKAVETWRTFAELTNNADPLVVARFWLKYRRERGGTMTVNEAVGRFTKLRATENLARDSVTHVNLHLRRLCATLGEKKLHEVTSDSIREWLAALADPETEEPLQPYTVRHHLRTVKLFFSTALREKWNDENPAEVIPLPSWERGEVTVLKIEEVERLFAANRNEICVGRLALEAFGGLRYTSAARLAREEILDVEKGIVMPGSKHKTGRRHYVDGYPENLWAWVEHAPSTCWSLSQRLYLNAKRDAFARAGVANPGNVLRHSFCSYHVALHKDAARTAVLLTHRSPSMLYQHYKGRATEADAKRYFEVRPA